MPTAGTLLNLTYDPTLQMRAAVKWIPWRGSAQYIPLYCKNYSAEVRGGRLLELNAFPARGENVQSSDGFSGSVLSDAQSDTVCACYFQIWGGTRTRKWREGEKKKNKLPNKRHGKLPKGEVASLFFTEAFKTATTGALRVFCHFFSVYLWIYWVDRDRKQNPFLKINK